jgi:hypothetical protein
MAYQHLPVYRRWTNRPPSDGPKPDAYRTAKTMGDYGFPERIAQAFLQTADNLKSAVLTRVPGKAATVLIDEGYCLKSFYIHAKSCNWGPMAGFVAFFPALNKKGVGNIDFNMKAHLETLKKFDNLAGKNTPSPFVPLGLTKNAAQRLENDLKTNGYFHEINDKSAIGILFDPSKTVLMEYFLQLQPAKINGYSEEEVKYAFHRNIYIQREEGKPYEAYINESDGKLRFSNNEETKLPIPTTNGPPAPVDNALKKMLDNAFTAGWKALKDKDNSIPVPTTSNVKDYYPIFVAQNPYRSYDERDPRNAITGDYDLFSVWPVGIFSRWEETIRLAEGRALAPSADFFGGVLFIPVLGKNFSLQLVHAPNVYIEVIPTFEQITGLEDPVLGNINDAVHLAAGMLNSVVYQKYGQKSTQPNVAFHSDEGGRPEVFEIEFPLAAFLPAGIRLPAVPPDTECKTTTEPRTLVITNAAEFLDLVGLLEVQANIPLAYGWLIHLLILTAQENTLDALHEQASKDADRKRGEKRDKYLKKRQDEAKSSEDSRLEGLRAQVWSLLTGYDIKDVLKQNNASQAMDQAAKVFFSLLYSAEDVYPKMTKILDITMESSM